MNLENEISPIDGLNKEQFEEIREQIIEYIQMYRTDGEPIGAYKIMKLFEPFLKIQEVKGFSDMMKASFRAGRKDFIVVLQENLQAQISGYYNVDKTDLEKEIRNAVIEEYKDLIAIYKAKSAE
jgi:hypothetical protein